MAVDLRVGDIGTSFPATVKDENGDVVDLSLASVMTMTFRKPNGVLVPKAGVLLSDGKDGRMTYVAIAGDLDQAGTWKVQGYVEIPGWSGHSTIAEFKVVANL